MLRSKKAVEASGAAAATLVAIIAGLIVLYILFIPAAEREELLDLDSDSDGRSYSDKDTEILIQETPGTIYEADLDEIEYLFPNINLNMQRNARIIKEVDSLYVRRALFDDEKQSFNFSLSEPYNNDNVLLSFLVDKGYGRLMVKMNGHEIFNREVSSANVDPIELDDYLEEENIVEFSVSEPGASFWETNEYSLEDIKITGDLLNKEAQESKNVFFVTKEEKEKIDKVKLRFLADCNPKTVEPLKIYVNYNNIYSAIPDCGYMNPYVEFAPNYLATGENRIVFKTEEGQYQIEQIKMITDLKEADYPIYYFEIDSDQFEAIEDEEANVNLTIRFADDEDKKEGKIIINGRVIGISQYELDLSENLDKYIEEGTNAVKIEPEDKLDISEIKIDFEGDVDEERYSDPDDDCKPYKYRKRCYRGDVWWYDSCGDRYTLSIRCTSREECIDGRCVLRD